MYDTTKASIIFFLNFYLYYRAHDEKDMSVLLSPCTYGFSTDIRCRVPCLLMLYNILLKDCLLLVLVALLSLYGPLSLYKVMKAHEAHRVVFILAAPVMACARAGCITVLYYYQRWKNCPSTVSTQSSLTDVSLYITFWCRIQAALGHCYTNRYTHYF